MRRLFPAVLPLTLLVGCLAQPEAFPLTRGQVQPGDEPHSLEVAGHRRHYLLHLPPGDLWSVARPLILLLHGTGSSSARMPEQTGMDAAADRRGLIVAYPDGTGHWPFARTWHTGRCCGLALEKGVDDVAFIRALITELRAKLAVDSSRIYVAGFSDGGMMTFRLGCELADQVAAIAVVAGRMPDVRCRTARPLPVVGFGGTVDEELRDDHARYTYPGSYPYAFSLGASMAYWAVINQCRLPGERVPRGRHWELRYAGCADDADVILYTITGGEHAWPGGRKGFIFSPAPVSDLVATDLILDFFQRHPLPAQVALPVAPTAAGKLGRVTNVPPETR